MPRSESIMFYANRNSIHRFRGIACIFDLAGFTRFCTQAEVESVIPVLLNRTNQLICSCLEPEDDPLGSGNVFSVDGVTPLHFKFLGDGGLIIWELPEEGQAAQSFILTLLNRLYVARQCYPDERDQCIDDVGVGSLPQYLRFGVAAGTILQLQSSNGSYEYVGFPINLAARLQSYCKQLGFLASARIGIPEEFIESHEFVKVRGKKLRGFDEEILVVDAQDFRSMSKKVQERLFVPVK